MIQEIIECPKCKADVRGKVEVYPGCPYALYTGYCVDCDQWIINDKYQPKFKSPYNKKLNRLFR